MNSMLLFLTGQYSCITSEGTSGMSLDNQLFSYFFLCLLFEHFYIYILLVEIITLLNITNDHDEREKGGGNPQNQNKTKKTCKDWEI